MSCRAKKHTNFNCGRRWPDRPLIYPDTLVLKTIIWHPTVIQQMAASIQANRCYKLFMWSLMKIKRIASKSPAKHKQCAV